MSSRFEFLEKFFAVWFYQKQKTTTQVRYIALVNRFTFAVNTISNLAKVIRAYFLGSDRLFYFISINKFGKFKDPFEMITSLSEYDIYAGGKNKRSDFYGISTSS